MTNFSTVLQDVGFSVTHYARDDYGRRMMRMYNVIENHYGWALVSNVKEALAEALEFEYSEPDIEYEGYYSLVYSQFRFLMHGKWISGVNPIFGV
jgi:hypothetical protein